MANYKDFLIRCRQRGIGISRLPVYPALRFEVTIHYSGCWSCTCAWLLPIRWSNICKCQASP